MGLLKRALEQLSNDLGRDGEITDDVLDHAERHPVEFAVAARTMRRRLGLPEVATASRTPTDHMTKQEG